MKIVSFDFGIDMSPSNPRA